MRDGVKFRDPGFHLAVVGALLETGAMFESSLTEHLGGIDPEGTEGDRIVEAVSRLHALPLDREAVAAIKALDFDGGNRIYMLIERHLDTNSGGEEDYYRLGALDGIRALEGLASLDLIGHGYREAALDLGPLARHPSLASLSLSGRCTSAAALETMPRLAKLAYDAGSLDDAEVAKRLAARGVAVRAT